MTACAATGRARRRSSLCLLLALICATPAAGAAPAGDSPNSMVKFTFAGPADGMGLTGIVHRQRRTEFLKAPAKPAEALLWKLELTGDVTKDGAFFGVTNRNATAKRDVDVKDGTVVMRWKGLGLKDEKDVMDVEVVMRPGGPHGLTEWRMHVTNRSRKTGIFRVIFPVLELQRIGESGEDDYLLAPPAEGRSVRNPIGDVVKSGGRKAWKLATDGEPAMWKPAYGFGFGNQRPHGLPYPTARGQMQFCAYYEKPGSFYYPSRQKGPGLYLATYDPAPHPKVFFMSLDPDRQCLLVEVGHYPEGGAVAGNDYRMPYPVILDGFEGDWYDASGLYRRWAVKQRWCRKGPIGQRRDVPDWVKRTTAFLRLSDRRHDNRECVPMTLTYRQHLKGVLMGQWYRWSALEKEPTYRSMAFPAVADAATGFREILADFHRRDIYVMPYVNVRLWDRAREGYDKAARFAARKRNGEPHTWGVVTEDTVEGSAYMCEGATFWRDYVLGVCRQMQAKFGVKALYLDQLTGAHFSGALMPNCQFEAGGCYDPTHGHPPGVGRWLVEAEHERASRIADALSTGPERFVLCGEGTDETLIDVTPVKLIHYEIWPGYVPIFGRVYHDYITYYGRTLPLAPDKIDGDPGPGMIIGWQLVLGNQLGRIWPSYARKLDDPVIATYLKFLQKACEMRDGWPQYLCTGQMLRPPHVIGEIPDLTTHEFRRLDKKVTLPAILAATWRAAVGKVAVVVANASREPVHFALELDKEELGWKGRPVRVKQVYPATTGEGTAGGPTIRFPLLLEGLDATLIELSPKGLE